MYPLTRLNREDEVQVLLHLINVQVNKLLHLDQHQILLSTRYDPGIPRLVELRLLID